MNYLRIRSHARVAKVASISCLLPLNSRCLDNQALSSLCASFSRHDSSKQCCDQRQLPKHQPLRCHQMFLTANYSGRMSCAPTGIAVSTHIQAVVPFKVELSSSFSCGTHFSTHTFCSPYRHMQRVFDRSSHFSILPLSRGIRTVFTSSTNFEPKTVLVKPGKVRHDEEKSKVEEALEAMKEKKERLKEKAFLYGSTPEELEPKAVTAPPKTSLWQKIKDEAIHYYNGFRLLFLDVKIAARLQWQVLNGKTLSRRERKQFLRTVSDMFRLVPFSVFLIIPFMEFLLPVAVKLFPGLLPSTFQDKSKKEEAKKVQLKAKIQMAKFLQDTVEELAITAKQKKNQEAVIEFANFFEKIRAKGEQPSNEDILRFSKLFEDEITLDNMSEAQLKAINRLLMLPTIGTSTYLQFQLRMKLRQLRADDLMIQKEGIESLTVQELQSACQARGMRAIGVPEARLRSQLNQWLELHLKEQIPTSLLLMSRALYLPEKIPKVDQLKETLSKLPEHMVEEAELKIAEVSGEEVDNRRRIEIIRKEEQFIADEKKEKRLKQEEELKRKEVEQMAADILVDKAPIVSPLEGEEISKEDWLSIKDSLALESDRGELERIKEDRVEYQEELKELVTEDEKHLFEESKASARLGKKVDKMINTIEGRLQRELQDAPSSCPVDEDGDGKITIQEMINAVRNLSNAPSESKCRKIAEMLDQDKDGTLELDEIGMVVELLSMEDVDLTSDQIADIVSLLKREEQVLEVRANEADKKEVNTQ